MDNAKIEGIKINCFVSDSAGKYAAASKLSWQRFISKNTNEIKTLSPDIISIIQNSHLWNWLYDLQDLLFPLYCVLNKLQKDVARLYEVAHCFGWLVKVFKNHDNEDFSDHMEQLLLLLSLGLHPNYQLSKFSSKIPKRILCEFLLYQREVFPFNKETYSQFDKNIIDFWESARGLTPELSRLALQLFGICEDISQELEEPFTSNNKIGSQTSNNLPIEPDNPQIKPDDLLTEPSEMTESKLTKAVEITGEGMINDSETSDDKEHWSNVVEDWIETLDLENRLENGEIVSDEPPEFEFCRRMIYLADDPLAKWNLSELFDNSLDAPIFFVF
ncbi:3961_t:CDS:2 [Cetraspora pellucida]|uniref:3961_t:CDS:1 n=1 Tax=Cetraspora pellucida TaxID=1433469 RepID=A0A9N9IA54_9GLOM|nr:3961_t:CDS:2 [Cetraspora pellucida]